MYFLAIGLRSETIDDGVENSIESLTDAPQSLGRKLQQCGVDNVNVACEEVEETKDSKYHIDDDQVDRSS